MSGGLPAITGPELIRLLEKIGWEVKRRGKHGLTIIKKFPNGRTLVTTISTRNESLPKGTLHDILKQTKISTAGLKKLL